MRLVPQHVDNYLETLCASADPVLEAMEVKAEERSFPIIGPQVGKLCQLLSRSIGAKRVFELGSGFGYSTLHFAKAVGPGGKVVHTERSAELQEEARAWSTQAGLAYRIEFRLGDAMDLLEEDPAAYDIIFVDIDKESYADAWRLARQHLRTGGLFIADNALWKGQVAEPRVGDEATRAVRECNRLAFSDPTFACSIVPVRDGVLVALRTA